MKLITIITILTFSWASLAQTVVEKGDVVKEDGILLTNEEAAKILASKEAEAKKCLLNIETEKNKAETICKAEKEVKDIALQSEKDKNEIILSVKQREIEKLTKQVEKESGNYDLWWFSGGVILGSAFSVAIFYAAVQIQQNNK